MLIAASGLLALAGLARLHFWGSLIVLDGGWNFGFIGATARVTDCDPTPERAKVQALNDFLVFGTVAAASFGSGRLLNTSGGDAINSPMLPLIAVVQAMLAWHNRDHSPVTIAP